MKKIAFLFLIFAFCIASKGFCDVTYNAKSTASQDGNQEVIRLDVIPIIDAGRDTTPVIKDSPVYVAPLIAPAQENKPSLNFNINNIKNVKKGAILPNDNVSQSITNVIQYFNYPYDKVFSHLLGVLENSELELVSYDSQKGRIFSNYKGEKPIYITVSQYNSSNVMVKITPADGIYNIPAGVTDKIFAELNRSLYSK